MEIHLNKCKKSGKENSGKTERMFTASVTPHDKTQQSADHPHQVAIQGEIEGNK